MKLFYCEKIHNFLCVYNDYDHLDYWPDWLFARMAGEYNAANDS